MEKPLDNTGIHRIPGAIARRWGSLKITSKFGLAFGVMLLIIVLDTVIGYAALTIVWEATNHIPVTSNIQRLAMDMSRNWETVRLLRNDFFYQSGLIGADQAYTLYALPAGGKIDEVIRDGATLKRSLSSPVVSEIIGNSGADLQHYLSRVSQYATTFEEATQLELQLRSAGTGLQSQLAQKATELSIILQTDPQWANVLVLFYEMRSFEQDDLSIQSGSATFSAGDAISRLRQAIETSAMRAGQKEAAIATLGDYERIAVEAHSTNLQIREKLDSLDEEDRSIEPNLTIIRAAVNNEVSRVQQRIDQTRQITIVMLVGAAVIGLVLAFFIATVLNRSVTRKVTRLTQVAGQLQTGNLAARAQIGAGDELGQLASTFNEMAAELGQTIGRLEIVNEAGLDFARELDVKRVIERALDTAIQLSDADAGLIGIAEGDDLVLAHAVGPYPPESPNYRLPLGNGIVLRAVRHRQTEVMMDGPSDTDDASLIPAGRARIAIPLVSAQQLIGVLYLEAREPERFNPNAVKFLALCAIGAAVAIHNARLYSDAQRKAIEDPLTGLYNRRGLFELSKRELSRAIRLRTPLAVLFIDIDHFKQFNDQYSYEVGDRILHVIATCLQKNTRDTDLVCRYGGEEFVVLLPETDQAGAVCMAERLRKTVEMERLPTDRGELMVTVSLGAAVLTYGPESSHSSSGKEEELLYELIDRAGQLLHLAKARGRNQVAVQD